MPAEQSTDGTEHGRTGVPRVINALAPVVAWVLLGYIGFQLAGWTGAILLPIGITVGLVIIVAPLTVIIVGLGLILQVVKACQRARQYLGSVSD